MGQFWDNKLFTILIFTLLVISLVLVQPTQSQENNTDKPFFEVTFLLWDTGSSVSDQLRIEYATLIAGEFEKIGIGVDIDIADTENYFDRFDAVLDDVVPLYNEGGLDITFIAYSDDYLDFASQRDEHYFRSDGDQKNTDFWNYFNPEFNQLYDKFISEFDPAKRQVIQNEIFDLIYEDLPSIPILQPTRTNYFNSQLNITKTDMEKLIYGVATSTIANLNVNGKDTLNMTYHSVPWITSPFWDQSEHIVQSAGQIYKNLIFQGLYERDPNDFQEWIPLIANDFPVWNNDHSVATITLREDVYFADGVNLTSYDVVESYKTYLTPLPAVSGNNNYNLLSQYFTNDSIVALDNYTVQFTFDELMIYPFNLLSKKILPIHTYGPHDNQTLPPDIIPEFFIFSEVDANGTSPFALGTGPYTVVGANFAEGTEFLQSTGNYWKGEVNTQNLNFFSDFEGSNIINRIKSGEIDFDIGGIVVDNNLTNLDSTVSRYEYDFAIIQALIVNFKHSHYGSGIDTPLGKTDVTQALAAARYVRQAMSHAIPREKIVEDITQGNAIPAAISVPNTVKGYNNDLEPYAYDIDRAKELMEMAGYEYPKEIQSTTTETSSSTSTNEDSNYPFGIYLLILPLILRYYYSKRH